MSNEQSAHYLGDGVYASFDGYQIWLDTRAQDPVNRIALEPNVWFSLMKYVESLKTESKDEQ